MWLQREAVLMMPVTREYITRMTFQWLVPCFRIVSVSGGGTP
jgi:hypothetical protein